MVAVKVRSFGAKRKYVASCPLWNIGMTNHSRGLLCHPIHKRSYIVDTRITSSNPKIDRLK